MDETSVLRLPSMKGAVFVDGRMVFRAPGTKSAVAGTGMVRKCVKWRERIVNEKRVTNQS